MKIKEMSNRKSNKMVSKMVDNMGYHCFYKIRCNVRLNTTIMNILILTYIFRYFTAIYNRSKDRIFIWVSLKNLLYTCDFKLIQILCKKLIIISHSFFFNYMK